jgi:hypothetical protein
VNSKLDSPFDKIAAQFARLGESLPKFPTLPKFPPLDWLDQANTIFRCAACGERVGRRRKGRHYQVPNDFTCSKHGELRDGGIGEIQAEWERRGKPEQWTVKMHPARRSASGLDD